MPATQPSTRVQRRAQPATPRRTTSRRRTAVTSATIQRHETREVSPEPEASSSVATTTVTVIWVSLWFVYPHTHITRDMSIPSNMAVVFCVSPKNHPSYMPSSLVIQDSGLQN